MKNERFFKILFWILTSIVIGGICFVAAMMISMAREDTGFPIGAGIFYIVMLLLMLAVFIGIAVFVYKDAAKRNMNRWMWMTIAVFVPNLIGLIIYIIVRSNQQTRCISCGKRLMDDFEVCPFCGNQQNLHCKYCGAKVSREWKVCPYCKNEL